MGKEYNIKDSLVSGDLGVSLIQFLSENAKTESRLGTQEEDRRQKIDMFINNKPCQVKTDYKSFSTQHAAMELAEVSYDRKKEQFGGNRAGSVGVMCQCGKQAIASQDQPNVSAGAMLQQPFLSNISNFIYVMLNVGIVFYNPRTLNNALWHWMRNHTDRDIVNKATWTVQPAKNPSYFSLNLLIPYKYLIGPQEVVVKKGYGNDAGESYMVEPYKFIAWADVQNIFLSDTNNKYREVLINNIENYINEQYNTKDSKELVKDAFAIQQLHNPVY